MAVAERRKAAVSSLALANPIRMNQSVLAEGEGWWQAGAGREGQSGVMSGNLKVCQLVACCIEGAGETFLCLDVLDEGDNLSIFTRPYCPFRLSLFFSCVCAWGFNGCQYA